MIAFETIFHDVMAARLAARQEPAIAPISRTGYSRRSFLLGASSASGLAVGAMSQFGWLDAFTSDPAITLTQTADGVAIRAGGVTWHIARRAFGPHAKLSWRQAPDGAQIRLAGASWPGLVGSFALAIRLSPSRVGGFRLALRGPELGYRANIDWALFAAGASADGAMAATIATRLTRRLRLTGAMRPAGLGLAASGEWSLIGDSDPGGTAFSATLSVREPGASELGHYAERPITGSSTLVRIDQWRGALSGAARTHDEADRVVVLEPTQIDRRLIEAFGDSHGVIERTDGCWRIAFGSGKARVRSCCGMSGSLVRLQRGAASDTAALLALPEGGLKVAGAAFHAYVTADALMDGLRWRTVAGKMSLGAIHGSLGKIDAHLPGADRTTLSFVGQPVALHLAANLPRAREAGVAGAGTPIVELSVAQQSGLRLPLDNAVLRVVRGVDLVNIAFRFRNMHLTTGVGGTRLVPRLKGKALRSAMVRESEDRPMLIAELPPQHVLERAFYRPPQAFAYPNVRMDPWPPLDAYGNALTTWEGIEKRKRELDPDYATFVCQYEKVDKSGPYVPIDPPIPHLNALTPSDKDLVQNSLSALSRGEMVSEWEESRVSGNSRLSFTFPYDPRSALQDLARASMGLNFALVDLMAWGHMEPVVALRASNFAAAKAKLAPKRKAASAKIGDHLQNVLEYQGIKPIDDLQKRLNQVADLRPPQPHETAIEIPARLILSPDQSARFFSSKLPEDAYRSGAVTPIWTTRMRVDELGGRVRAIWSPDYDAGVYTDYKNRDHPYPPRDATPPWQHGDHATFRASMSPADRHELVALTSLIGLPILPAGPPNSTTNQLALSPDNVEAVRLAATNVTTPPQYVLSMLAKDNQNVYVPDGILVSELTLSGLHGSISLDDHFQPPAAALLSNMRDGLFPALNIEAARIRAVLGYDHDVAISYKGFLFPLGIPATLVKQTSRAVAEIKGVKVSYLKQHYYINTPSKVRVVPMQGQPFDGRDLPFTSMRPKGGNSPDVRDPYLQISADTGINEIDPQSGRIKLDFDTPGIVFWPIDATSPEDAPARILRFEVHIDNGGTTLNVPLIFIDNTAAHDAPTLAALVRYYMHAIPMIEANGKTAPQAFLRFAEVSGGSLTYARETTGGQCSFETRRFLLGVRSKNETDPAPICTMPADAIHCYIMESALEGMNQLPAYPFVVESHIGLANIQHFTGQPITFTRIGYNAAFVRYGFDGALNPNHYYLDVFGKLDEGDWLAPAPQPAILPIAGQGQRSGFAQPSVVVAHIAREKGPVGDNNPPKPPCEFMVPKPATGQPAPRVVRIAARPALRRLAAELLPEARADTPPAAVPATTATTPTPAPSRMLPTKMFSSDATLLGLVKIADVFKAALFEAAPQLSQEMDDASNQVGGALATLMSQLTDYVKEIETALHSAAAGLDAALAQVEAITFAGTSIAKIYPAAVAACEDVATTFANIGKDLAPLDEALTSQNQLNFVTAAQKVYTDLGAFNDALGKLAVQMRRIAADPAPGLLGAAVGGMLDFIGGIDSPKQGIAQTIMQAILEIQKSLGDALSRPEFAWYRAIQLGPDFYAPTTIARLLSQEGLTSIAKAPGFQSYVQPAFTTYDQYTKLFVQDQVAIGQVSANAIALAGEMLVSLEAQLEPILLGKAFAQVTGADLTKFLKGLLTCDATSLLRQADFAGTELPAVEKLISQLLILETDLSSVQDDTRVKALSLADVVKSYRVGVAAAYAQLSQANSYLANAIAQLKTLFSSNSLPTPDKFTQPVTQLANARRDAVMAAQTLITASKSARQALTALARDDSMASYVARAEAGMLGVVQAALALLNILTSLSAKGRSASYIQPISGTALADLHDGLNRVDAKASSLAISLQNVRADTIDNILVPADALAAQIVQFALQEETHMLAWVASAIAFPASFVDNAWQPIVEVIALIVQVFAKACKDADTALTKIIDLIPKQGEQGYETVRAFLAVFAPDILELGALLATAETQLAAEALNLQTLAADLKNASKGTLGAVESKITAWRAQFDEIAAGGSNLQATISLIASAAERLSKIHIDQVIDFPAISRQLESAVIAAVAPNLSVSYSLDTQLSDIAPYFYMNRDDSMAIARDSDSDLSIRFSASMNSMGSPAFSILSRIQPFIVNVFEIVILYFAPGSFSGGGGQSFDMHLKVAGFELGETVQFLAALGPFLSVSGDDDGIKFLVAPSLAPVGVRAQLDIHLGTISLGEISFINVNFGAAVLLPFENQPAQFTVALASRDNPFLICCMPYGGGGFLSMTANTNSIVAFEASFEFGVVLAFSYGPLSAVGYVCTGIYVAKTRNGAEISAIFLASGSAHIACFGISACLLVSMTAVGGNLTGSATFTFSFSIGMFHIQYSVGVAHQISQWGGSSANRSPRQPAQTQTPALARSEHTLPTLLAMVSLFDLEALAAVPAIVPAHQARRKRARRYAIPALVNEARSMDGDWLAYKSYFRGDI